MDIERAKTALKNAHAAGDTEAARKIANAIKAQQSPAGNNAGAAKAYAYGISGGQIPFGNRLTSAIGAAGAKTSDAFRKDNLFEDQSFKDLYSQSLADTKKTQEANPKATLAGNVTGIATTLPLAFSKTLFGTKPTQGIRGTLNEIPTALSAVGDFARSGKAAKDAGVLTKAGSLALRSGKGALVAAPVGALYGAGEADPGEMLEGAKRGGRVAAGVGATLPVVGAIGSSALDSIVPVVDDALKPLAKRARDFGIPLRADQVAPTRARRTFQKISQEIPFSGADAFEDVQRKNWTRALATTIGEQSDDLGPNTIQSFRKRVSKAFDEALDGVNVQAAPDDLVKLSALRQEAAETIEEGLSVVEKNIDKTLDILKSGSVKGEKLASLRSELLKKSTRAKGASGEYIGEIIEQLDDVIERNLPAEKITSLAKSRREWRNFKTIKPLLEKSTDGFVNPTDLLSRVSSNKFIDASSVPVGQDDLIDLARIGKEFMPKLGGSDTFQKSALGAGSVGLLGTTVANPALGIGLAAKAGGVMAVNRGIQQGVLSNQRLIDRGINSVGPGAMPALEKSVDSLANILKRQGALEGAR